MRLTLLLLGLLWGALASADSLGLSDEYRFCMNNAATQQAAELCLRRELARQDTRLNNVYRRTMERLDPERQAALRQVQRLWIRWRDAKCNFLNHPRAGSGGRADELSCRLKTTALRAAELEALP